MGQYLLIFAFSDCTKVTIPDGRATCSEIHWWSEKAASIPGPNLRISKQFKTRCKIKQNAKKE